MILKPKRGDDALRQAAASALGTCILVAAMLAMLWIASGTAIVPDRTEVHPTVTIAVVGDR